MVSSLQVFRLKFCIHFSPLPCMLHSPLVSASFIGLGNARRNVVVQYRV
jgi:hypothetical protein